MRNELHTYAPVRHITRPVWIGCIVGAIMLFAGANAHLIYVAVTSQPGCVPHHKNIDTVDGTFRAAKPSC